MQFSAGWGNVLAPITKEQAGIRVPVATGHAARTRGCWVLLIHFGHEQVPTEPLLALGSEMPANT